MKEQEFIQKMVDGSNGFRTATYLGITTKILDVEVMKVNFKGDEVFLPFVIHASLEVPKKGDTVIILGDKVIGKTPEVVVESNIPNVRWSDIIGLDSQVNEIIESINNMEDDVSGILLYGPTGTGKTLIAKAIASHLLGEVDARFFFYLKGGSVLTRYVGESERKITEMFHAARELYRETNKRPIVFIDEADAILHHRGSIHYIDTLVATFLSEMDGFDGYNPLVILATNHRNKLDEAIVRPGRMDLHLEINRPNKADFCKQLVHYGIPEDLCEECATLVETKRTPFTGALAKSIGKFTRQKAKGEPINTTHILKAIEVSC